MSNTTFLKKGEYTHKVPGGYIKYYVHNDIPNNLEFLPVFFHGAQDRATIILPRFEGLTIFQELGIPAISFSDPVLEMNDEITLAWFAGNDTYQGLQGAIHNILNDLALQLKCKLILHGSSGGGFAALTQQYLFGKDTKHIAIVQNPQTAILRYHKGHVDRYFKTFTAKIYNQKKVLEELEIVHELKMDEIHNVIYFQNVNDSFHISNHLLHYMNENIKVTPGILLRPGNTFIIGNWGDGHKRLPPEVVKKIFSNLAWFKDINTVKRGCFSLLLRLLSSNV